MTGFWKGLWKGLVKDKQVTRLAFSLVVFGKSFRSLLWLLV